MLVAGVYKGVEARKQKNREANAYLDANKRRKAAMTRDVEYAEKEKETLMSRARAVAAVQGGGGLGTSGMTRIMGDLEAEGDYRVLGMMWKGLDDAAALTFRAEAAQREGEAAFNAGVIDGVTSAISAYFGMGGSFGSTKIPQGSSYKPTIGQTGGLDLPGYGTIARGGATA
jgi:hypothetical protein